MRILSALAVIALASAVAAQAQTPKADALFAQGRFVDAKKAYAAVSPKSADYQPAMRRLGAIALFNNNLAEAERDLLIALSRDPDNKITANLLAEVANRQGAFAKSAFWLKRAGNAPRAAAFAAFGNAMPYRITSSASGAEIRFTQTDPLPAVLARVNGKEGLFLIDTGGAEIVLDPTFAMKTGVKPVGGDKGVFAGGKSATIAFGRIANFSIGELTVTDVPAELIPTSALASATKGKPVAGVIGTGLLSRFLSTIDYANAKLILAPKTSQAPKDSRAAEIPFWLLSDHLIVARGKLDNGPEQPFIVDTGLAGFAITAPRSTLRAAGIAIPQVAQQKNGAIGISAAVPFPVAAFTLGTLKAANLQGLYGPFPPTLENGLGVHIGGIVSHQFFRPYAITFDFTHMQIIVRTPKS
jgi:hypothetical protein